MKKFLGLFILLCLTGDAQSLPLSADLLVPLNTSTPGTILTSTIADMGTLSNICTVGTTCSWATIPTGNSVGIGHSNCSNLGPVQLGGNLYSAGSLDFNSIAHLDADNTGITNFDFNITGISKLSILVCITLGIPNQLNGNDYDTIFPQDSQGHYAEIQFTPNSGNFAVRIETDANGLTHSNNISLTSLGTYWFSLNVNTLGNVSTLSVFTTQGVLVGTVTATSSFNGDISNIRIFSNENGTDSGTTYMQNIMMNWTTAPNPLFWTLTVPLPPTNLVLTSH